MKGGSCSNCSCGKINEPFAGYGLKLGGSSSGRNHKGGSSCGIKHKGGSSCGRNHRGGFQEPLPGNESKTLQAVPKTNQKGGGKSKRKLQSNKRKRNHNLVTKRNNKKKRNNKLRGGSMKCPVYDFDLNDQIRGQAVVKIRESCKSS